MPELNSQRSRKRWFILGIATLSQVSVSAIRLGLPALVPFIKEELKLSRTEVGFLSSVLNLGSIAAGIPAGKAADRFGEKLFIGCAAIAAGLIVMGLNWVENYLSLLPALIITGFAAGSSTPAGSKAIAGWFSADERGTAMGVRQMAVPLGGAIAAVSLPPLATDLGWRVAFAVAGAAAVGTGLVAGYFYEEPAGAPVSSKKQPVGVGDLILRKDILAVLIFAFVLGGGQWCYLTYLELYLTEVVKLPLTIAAALLASGQIFGAAGRIIWGVSSDKLFRGRRKPALLIVGILAALMSLGISLFSPQTPLWLIVLSFALLGLSLLGWQGLSFALISELVESRVAGLAIGLNQSVALSGIMVLPPLFGFFVDLTDSYRGAWIGLSALIVFTLTFFPWIREK